MPKTYPLKPFPKVARRDFLRYGAASVAGAAAFGATGLPQVARASGGRLSSLPIGTEVQGGLFVAGPELALPEGFTYKTFGAFGSAMTDGFITPPIHDGMGVFEDGENIRIVRNHELGEGNDVLGGSVVGRPSTAYDRKAPGCTTTLILDSDANLLESFISLNGTDTNCSGTPTPWNTWLTCEETVIGTRKDRLQNHGYVFEVDPFENESVKREPLRALGRWVHEAAGVDPDTGVVYMTEDWNPDGFYRFVPETFGDLTAGTVQTLKIKGEFRYNTITGQTVGVALPAKWVTIDDPDPADAETHPRAVRHQGREKGSAVFLSGEGCTMLGNSVVFDSSDGGDAGLGQIWKYTPTMNAGDLDEEGELELWFESSERRILDGPDNLGTTPGGGIVIAEDGHENASFVRGLRPDGTMVNIAKDLVPIRLHIIDASGKTYDPYVPDDDYSINDGLGFSEFAGPRFSPDGQWLFVNIQVPGITCAITGDWDSLGL
jgi:hypothetical protein